VETRELTCIQCPRGCALRVEMDGHEVISVSGNACRRGDIYAREEVVSPVRTLTSTVRVVGGVRERVSVRTKEPIAKGLLGEAMRQLNALVVEAPVRLGDVLLHDIAKSGTDLIATAHVDAVDRAS
jgi:CxxC motif-containing protein